MASFLWRNDDLRRLRTRNLVLQGADGSYPAADALLRFVDAEGTVGASGIFVDDSGNLVVTGSADISGGLTVGGSADISGSLTVGGDADISGHLTVGSMTIDTLVLDSLSVTGSVDISGGLTVGGVTDLSGNLRVTGNVGITHVSTTATENKFVRTFNDPCGGHFLSTTDYVVGQNDDGFGGIGPYRDYRYIYGTNVPGGNRNVWGIVNDASGGNPGNVEFYQAITVSAKNNSDPNSAITIGGTRGRSMHRVFPGASYNALVTEVASGVGNVGYKLDAQYFDGVSLTYGADLLLNSDTGVANGVPGNVGIGTATPSTKLHVSGGDVLVEDASYAEISCRGSVILDGSSQIPAGDDVIVGRVNVGTQSFGTSVCTTIPASGSPRYTDRCRMDLCTPLGFGGLNQIQASRLSIMPFTGNVGIGTTGPQALLDVSGDMRITGDIINPTGWINPVGSITMYGGASAPNGWFLCDGSAISRATYSRLFAVISTTFGNGDGVSTFNLPNLTNRFPANYGGVGATGGSATATLATANLPAHSHTITSLTTSSNGDHNHTFTVQPTDVANSGSATTNPKWGAGDNAGSAEPYNGTTANAGSHSHTVSGTTDNTGSGSSFSILPPYISLNFIIKY